ncbi:MAG: hypothetical protein JSR65_03120 [Proteobacteria bacterium]|nr:hypothetical protein [Pseudomonadota bacterium]
MSSFQNLALAATAALACLFGAQAQAADRSATSLLGSRTDFSEVQAQRAALLAAPRSVSAKAAGASIEAVTPTALTSNSYRAYPPSCFSDTLPNPSTAIQPLPVTPSGTLYSRTVTLYEKNGTQDSAEDVTITIWRVACSSSGDKLDGSNGQPAYNPDGGYVGATLMRIQRQAQYEGDSKIYPQYPDIRISQGSIAFDNPNFTDYVRVASEPNTVVSDTLVGSPVINSTTYVLENYPNPNLGFFLLNHAFTIRFDNGYQNGKVTTSVPDYNPTQQTYPAAFNPMAVNGYLTGVWRQPNLGSGEGMVTQVLDRDAQNRTFFAYWYTYNSAGVPFWLVAQTDFPIGTTQLLNVPVYYTSGGYFAPPSPPAVPYKINTWGTITVTFPDCQHIKIAYNGTTNGGPGGTSTQPLTWTRLGSINNLACQ